MMAIQDTTFKNFLDFNFFRSGEGGRRKRDGGRERGMESEVDRGREIDG